MKHLFQIQFIDGSSTYYHAETLQEVETRFGIESIKSIHRLEVMASGKV